MLLISIQPSQMKRLTRGSRKPAATGEGPERYSFEYTFLETPCAQGNKLLPCRERHRRSRMVITALNPYALAIDGDEPAAEVRPFPNSGSSVELHRGFCVMVSM